MAEKIGLQAVLDLSSFSAAVASYNSAISGMSSNTASTASSISSSFGGLGSSILDIGAKAAQVAVGGIALLGSALVAIGVQGTTAFIQLEQGFANLEAISGDTKAQLEPLKGLISDLALDPNLKVTANEATEAMYALTKQGLSVEQIMGGAGRATVELSNATGAQFTPAATIAAGVMKAWNIEASNLSTVADGMTGVLTNSKFSVDDYNLAFSQSGAIFSNLGGSLTDFNTVIAGTSSAFSGGSDAGTSFKNLILTMSAPTNEAKAAMDQYGISIFNADGTMKNWSEVAGQLNKVLYGTVEVTNTVGGATKEQAAAAEKASSSIGDLTRDIGQQRDKLQLMNDVYQESLKFYDAGEPKMRAQALAIERLSSNITDQEEQLGDYQKAISAVDGAQERTITSTKNLTEAERAKLAETIAGRDSSRLLLELGKMTSDQYDELSGKINKNGQAMNASAIRMDTTSGALDILMGIVEAIQLQIGEKFTPMVKAAAKAMSLWASENSGGIIAFFGTVADGLQGMITGLGKAAGAFSRFGVRGAAISILGQLGFTPESIASVTSTIDTIVSEIGRIQAVFASFGLSGVAFSIGGLLGLDSDSMIAIQTTVTGIIATITGFATQVQALFAGMGIEEFKGALFGIGAVLATGVFAALVAGALSLLTPFTLLTGAVILFSTAWAGNWGGIQEIAATTFATITELFNQFMLTWNTNWPIIQAIALTAWEIIQGIMAGFQTALGPVIAQLTIQFTQIGASLAGMGINWTTTWDAIVTATGIVAAGIGAAILLIVGVVAGLATGIAGGISAAITLFQSLATTATEVFAALTTIMTGWITTISALLSGDFAGAWEGFKTVLQGTVTLVTSIFTGMLSAVTGVLGVMTATIGGFAEGIVGFFQGMYDSLIGNSIIPDLVNGIVKWFKDLPQKIVSSLGDLTTKVVAPFEKLGTTIKGELGEAITWLTDDALPLLNKGLDFVIQSIKDVIGYFNSLKDTVSSFSLPDILTPGSPPPMANALADIAGGAQRATQAIADMGRNMLTSGASARDFFGSLDAGGIAAGNQVSNWNDLRDILQLNTSTAMNILASGGGSAGIMDLVRQESANWGISPALASSIVESQGLMDHLMGTFNEFQTQMRLENLGNMLQMGGSFSGIAGTLADMLQAQMGNADEANKTVETYQKLSTEIDTSKNKLATLQQELEVLTTSEGAHQIALDKKNLAIEKTTEAIEFNRRQLEIYEQELAGMQEGTLAWDKKKLSIDKTTEAIDSQGKQLITLKEELEKLDVANNADTLSIEKKRLEIEKLTAEMAKNQQAVIAAREDFEALATGSAADQIAFLQSFLESGANSIRLIGEELGGVFAGQGLTSDVYWTRVAAQERLAELLEEQRRQEELITQQKEAQGKLDKLKAQLDLINLGRQLGGDIFAGINFGLDASIEDLLAATNAVTMAMVDQINHDLQIHSPSGVMIKTFEQVMAGAALGVRRGESMLSDAVRSIPILNGSMPQFSQAAGISNSSTYNYNFPMTVNTAATAQGVVRQYDVRRSLANV